MTGARIIIAGGGTSGHINPALAIADEIKRAWPDSEMVFCGTAQGLEHEMIPRAGYAFVPIEARGLPTRLSKQTMEAVRSFFRGRKQCRQLIRQFRPDAVVGTGGYVCSPLIAAAAQLRIPALLHEQNAYPGRSNRLLAGRCQAVCISFEGTQRYFRTNAQIVLTGNPVRQDFFQFNRAKAREELGLSQHLQLVLIMGGSLGARTLNQAVLGLKDTNVWNIHLQKYPDTRLVLAAGKQQFETVRNQAADQGSILDVHDYLFNAPLWMAAADLVIGRAGAMTCAELAALGRASILVPYPYAAGDHQMYNARTLSNAGAAVVMEDDACTPDRLASELSSLLGSRERLEEMERAAADLALPDAAGDIVRCLGSLIK